MCQCMLINRHQIVIKTTINNNTNFIQIIVQNVYKFEKGSEVTENHRFFLSPVKLIKHLSCTCVAKSCSVGFFFFLFFLRLFLVRFFSHSKLILNERLEKLLFSEPQKSLPMLDRMGRIARDLAFGDSAYFWSIPTMLW